MAGLRTGGPNFPENPVNNQLLEWMWWRWIFSTSEGTWSVDEVLDSPSNDTPGLIYFTPDGASIEPPLTNEWWWIPHTTHPETGVITVRGKLHVRDRSNVPFNTDVSCDTAAGEWAEIHTENSSDPSIRGPRGYTVWADYGVPETDLLIDGERPTVPPGDQGPPGAGDDPNNWPYSGDVDDLLGDMYLDLAGGKIYGPKFIDSDTSLASWGQGISILGPVWANFRGPWDCEYAYDYQVAPHDIVTHTQYDRSVLETWICTTQHTPQCDTAVLEHTFNASYATQAGVEIGPPPSCSSSSYFYLRHDYSSSVSYHYYLQTVPHKHIASSDPSVTGVYYVGVDSIGPNAPGAHSGESEIVNYDASNDKHILVQVKVGGPQHSEFRFRTPGTATWVYSTGINYWPTDYDGDAGSGEQGDYTFEAYQPNCWCADVSPSCCTYVGSWGDSASTVATQISSGAVSNAMLWAIRKMAANYYSDSNSWGLNFWFTPGWIGGNYGVWSLVDAGSGGPAADYPKFYTAVEAMPYYVGDCSGDDDQTPPTTCSMDSPCGDHNNPQMNIWGVSHECGAVINTYDHIKESPGVLLSREPFEGSTYWTRLLGIN